MRFSTGRRAVCDEDISGRRRRLADADLSTSCYGYNWVQVGLASLSLLLGGSYMLCFAIWPDILCVYPLTLAFWIYASDFVLTLQLLASSALRIAYTADGAALNEPWPLTSDTDCLCDFNPNHPGCKCDGGAMSFLLQVRTPRTLTVNDLHADDDVNVLLAAVERKSHTPETLSWLAFEGRKLEPGRSLAQYEETLISDSISTVTRARA